MKDNKSTEKLKIIENCLAKILDYAYSFNNQHISELQIGWDSVDDGFGNLTAVPTLTIKFKKEEQK